MTTADPDQQRGRGLESTRLRQQPQAGSSGTMARVPSLLFESRVGPGRGTGGDAGPGGPTGTAGGSSGRAVEGLESHTRDCFYFISWTFQLTPAPDIAIIRSI